MDPSAAVRICPGVSRRASGGIEIGCEGFIGWTYEPLGGEKSPPQIGKMSYKDKEQQREYQREWCRRKLRGLDTRIKPRKKLSRKNRLAKRQENKARYKRARIAILRKVFGNVCTLCEYSDRLRIHRKDGLKHESPIETDRGLKSVLSEPDKYVAVCFKCHNHTHWCMRVLHMTWEEIKNRASL